MKSRILFSLSWEKVNLKMTQLKRQFRDEVAINSYPNFSKINGNHPLKTVVPSGYVEYKARHKKGGKVSFFNYALAREMGLINKSHPDEMNTNLEREILETFSLVIINEFDIINKTKILNNEILPNTFIATRYLQLQHPDKLGRTSGDGRSIWNGTIRNNGITWDISSCGTGATKLSPACNINKKFYKTGDPTISYGCGLSEVSEGLETLFFSEALARNGFKTERILAIIEFEKGLAINVRAYPNLIRPSHFFCHLKQGNLSALKQMTDYYIDRQIENKVWQKLKFKDDSEKYNYLAEQVALSFSQTAARFEDEYIFCWLDWDGDNILMDGGIIDYGSIRQFGLFHAEYRYDDVQRYSTNIVEQKNKAKYITQCFLQIADYLITGNKKSLSYFRNHRIIKLFEKKFQDCKNRNLLLKIGFKKAEVDYLLSKHLPVVLQFRRAFTYFERSKSKRGLYKVADGITWDAIFCMRDILRELPQIYLTRGKKISYEDFLEIIKSSYATQNDLKITQIRKNQIDKFQNAYRQAMTFVARFTNSSLHQVLLNVTMRSSVINKYDRITGDSITFIVDKVKKTKPRLTHDQIYRLAMEFSNYQNLNPETKLYNRLHHPQQKKIMQNIHGIVRECREGL
jgi:uncharacterized protein YdiU (UPF0061 family)